MAKYDHINYGKLSVFIYHLPEAREQFQAIIHEGQLVVRTALQTTLNLADTVACSVLMVVVMRWVS